MPTGRQARGTPPVPAPTSRTPPNSQDHLIMPYAIEADALQKTFTGKHEVRALDGVSFSVEEGTVFGLLGPNGSGKTTAVRVLTTILKADGGSARVLGHDVRKKAALVRTLIGLAGQYAAVDENLTGRENLQMVGRLNHLDPSYVTARAAELLDQFDLADAGDRPLKTYSGGMRRRLDLAAALVARPTVLFLDEPTTGLDPQSRNDLWEVIESLVGGGTTVLLTTQYLEEADRLANDLVVIDHGQVIAEGTPESAEGRPGRHRPRGRPGHHRRRAPDRRALRVARAPHADRQRHRRRGHRGRRTHVGDGRPPLARPGGDHAHGLHPARAEPRRRLPGSDRPTGRGRDRGDGRPRDEATQPTRRRAASEALPIATGELS